MRTITSILLALACAAVARAEIKTALIEYKQDDTTLEGLHTYDTSSTGRRPGVTIDDAMLALATVQAVYESVRTGGAVRVADVLDRARTAP